MTDFIKSLIKKAQRLQLTAVLKGLPVELEISENSIFFFFHDYTKTKCMESEVTMFHILFCEGKNECIAEMKKVKDFVFGWKTDNKK